MKQEEKLKSTVQTDTKPSSVQKPIAGLKEEKIELQTITRFLVEFLKKIKPKKVVEIGSDIQLKLALEISRECRTVYAIDFPDMCDRKEGWLELHEEEGGVKNIEQLRINAMNLSQHIPQADVVIVKNVALELENGDMMKVIHYRKGKIELSESERKQLEMNFFKADELGYKEFLKVVKEGYLIIFKRPDNHLKEMLIEIVGVPEKNIMVKQVKYDDEHEEVFDCYIIGNKK